MNARARPRVLWLTKGLGRGGAERLLTLLARHVDPGRFDVEVAYVLAHKDALVAEFDRCGVPVHCLGGGRRGSVAWPSRLRRLARRRGYRLVHTHSPLPAAVARLALAPSTVFVHTEHNVWRRYRWPTYAVNAVTYRRNAAVLAVSRGVAESIAVPRWAPGRGRPPVEVLYHGIDDTLVRRGPAAAVHARKLLGLAAGDMVVGSVANFTAKKDQRTLLRAVEHLAAELPGVRLVLVGTGPLQADLQARAARSGLDDRVLFTGSRDDVQELLPAFDVFALSSLHEGLSIALIEAMASGLPCVATRVGGVSEILRDGEEGLLVPPGDPAALATALAKVLHDPGLRSAMGARGTAQALRFTVAGAAGRMQAVYDAVLGAP